MQMRVFTCALRVGQKEHYSGLRVLVNTRVVRLSNCNDIRQVVSWQNKFHVKRIIY